MMVPVVGSCLSCAASRSGNASAAKSNASPAKNVIAASNIRNLDFMFVSFFVEVELLNCINCNPVPRGTRNHPHEAL